MLKKHEIESSGTVPPKVIGGQFNKSKSIFWGILSGVLFGALIGVGVGVFLRPKEELTEMSQEWLEELKDVADQVSGTVRDRVSDLVSKRLEPSERYEEFPGSYV